MVVLAGGGETNNLLCRGDPASNLTANIRDIGETVQDNFLDSIFGVCSTRFKKLREESF